MRNSKTTEIARPANRTDSEFKVAVTSVPSLARRQNATTVSWNGARKMRGVSIPPISQASKQRDD